PPACFASSPRAHSGGATPASSARAPLPPPLVSFYIGHGSSNWPAVQQARYFAVNLMGHNHQDTAARFARKGADRFGPATEWRTGPAGLPLLAGATLHPICATPPPCPVGGHQPVGGPGLSAGRSQPGPP